MKKAEMIETLMAMYEDSSRLMESYKENGDEIMANIMGGEVYAYWTVICMMESKEYAKSMREVFFN